MSDRRTVPSREVAPQWIRQMEDRLRRLEQRKYQGEVTFSEANIASGTFDSAVIASLSGGIAMPSTAPMKLNGSAGWTQSLEQVGNPAAPSANIVNTHALITRDPNGSIVDISPRPWIQLTVASSESVATGVRTTIPAARYSQSYSVPYTFDQTYDSVNGAIIIPVQGFWQFFVHGTWAVVADATVRSIVPQISTNGGASWADHYVDTKTANNNASDAATHTFPFEQGYVAGTQFRLTVFHRSATTPIAFTPTRFIAVWQRGFV